MSASENELSPGEEDLEVIEENDEPEAQGGLAEEAEEAQEAQEEENPERKEVKVKRVRNPQPKLNVERLKGPRGLKALETIFGNVTFKGPKHEEEDLQVMMKHYEYWCHRLFPKFPFDDCLEKMEKLGTKKPLQVHLKKMRMNMDDPPEPQDEIIESDKEDEDIFDRVAATSPQPPTANQPRLQPHTAEPSAGLTEDQLERIKLNRLKAQKLREQAVTKKNEDKAFRSTQFHGTLNPVDFDADALKDVNFDEDFDVASKDDKQESHTETVVAVREPNRKETLNKETESEEFYFVSQKSIAESQESVGESRCFETVAQVHNEDIPDVQMSEVPNDEEGVKRTDEEGVKRMEEDLDAISVID